MNRRALALSQLHQRHVAVARKQHLAFPQTLCAQGREHRLLRLLAARRLARAKQAQAPHARGDERMAGAMMSGDEPEKRETTGGMQSEAASRDAAAWPLTITQACAASS